MKLNKSTLTAAALAGLFTAGTAMAASQQADATPASVTEEKSKCSGKDGCKGKDKDKDKDKDKEKCSGKEGCKGKDGKSSIL